LTNVTSSLPFTITDNAIFGSQFSVQAVSSDTNLAPIGDVLTWGLDANGNWTLTLTPAANQTGTVTLTLVVTDDAGLSSDTSIRVSVMMPKVAEIPDANLLATLLTMLGRPVAYITDVDLLNLTELDAADAGISSLSGLQGAVHLTTLQLDGNSISDLGPLAKLWQMTSLSLSNNFIRDMSPLAGLTNLNYLALGGNSITNWEVFLSGFSSLTDLDLAGNSISNLTFLQNLTQLTFLELDDNWITDLSPLVSLTNLTSLNLQYNLLTNILALTNLMQLSLVDVSFNYLDTTSGSATTSAIQNLQNQGAVVYYLPQVEFQPEIQLELAVGPANLQLIARGVPGARYQFQTSTNLVDWAVLATIVSTNDVMFSDVDPAAGACFYRIKVLNP
jgi:Leucine-rich repeat (LRR) protein